jgi:signal peptidase
MFTTLMVGLVLLMTGAFSYKPIVIMSDSMLPVFARGSVVIVQRVQGSVDIRIGDIIQYKAGNKMITHRVVDMRPADDGSGRRVFTTKGDNNRSQDPPVDQSHVVGVIRSAVPYIGYPTVWLKEVSKKV